MVCVQLLAVAPDAVSKPSLSAGWVLLIEDDVGEFSDTYLKLEDTLFSDHKSALDELRVGFSTIEVNYVNFEVEVQVVNGTNVSCDGYIFTEHSLPAFCPASSDTSEYIWELCYNPMYINFNVLSASELQSKDTILEIDQFII